MEHGSSLIHLMTKLVFQLSVIIIAAKLFGFMVSRYLKQSSVLGEIVAGMIIGPFALGGIPLALFGGEPLFIIPQGVAIPIMPELEGFATVASIVLLFLSGLETNLKTFLRFAGVGALVGLGGVLVSFFLGAGSVLLFLPGVSHWMDPKALFMGIIATATSVGITARILSEQRELSSPEGVTILSAAVLDDVLGIILLAIVVGLTKIGSSGGIEWALVGSIALKAVGFWLSSTVIGIVLAPRLTKRLKRLKDLDALAMISLGLALLLAGLSEKAGLAMIIGAYVMGLALSSTDVAEDIRRRLEGLYNFIVPIFFCVMGMMVNFALMPKVLGYGLLYAALSVVGKLIGAGGFSLFGGFNLRGAYRIGAGMLPRGEVTLIMASLGLSTGVLDSGLFGVAVIAMFTSSLVAPPVLVRAFKGGSGYKGEVAESRDGGLQSICFEIPSEALADFVLNRLLEAFRVAEFFPRRLDHQNPVYTLQKDATHITLYREGVDIICNVAPVQEPFVRLLLAEEILSLKELFRNVEKMAESDLVERNIIGDLFADTPKK